MNRDALTLADDLVLTRMGYGAMQLAGPGAFGPVRDRAEAVRVLRTVADLGITHIDTSDYYGPVVTNELIREALHPYPEDLRIVTKVGFRRGEDGSWQLSGHNLREQVQDNLKHLGLDALDAVNLRVEGPGSLAERFGQLVELQREGLVRHLGLSNVTAEQIGEARQIAPIVFVQNLYNIVLRDDDALIDQLAADGIGFVPFFPLGGFSPVQSDVLEEVAASVGASVQQTALAWLLRRSPNILLIPGTSSVAHLRENVAAADVELPEEAMARLTALAG
ncbi:aryl-alcohol dehydrogenase-like predicted oxidoreductase [Actinoplanes octamycinicus]|uniref:Aryl-alcohol dehydrogenase-like predicted oxidoreductase n=1 Tax=Actinoplanes octamycinicus TaxID=135948 RepID=A0A7W7M9J9_9ACTN|nr:oxidoreductase [Actinoplanes octamycinicus]MBB4742098.1 aryl-alcohol dehydrogenase-like predicted oxidoreductase [Actinoplanes octamycinicus]GIE60056.1 putative oxidoreductase YdbC [Actinoplanes octamycinicus]